MMVKVKLSRRQLMGVLAAGIGIPAFCLSYAPVTAPAWASAAISCHIPDHLNVIEYVWTLWTSTDCAWFSIAARWAVSIIFIACLLMMILFISLYMTWNGGPPKWAINISALGYTSYASAAIFLLIVVPFFVPFFILEGPTLNGLSRPGVAGNPGDLWTFLLPIAVIGLAGWIAWQVWERLSLKIGDALTRPGSLSGLPGFLGTTLGVTLGVSTGMVMIVFVASVVLMFVILYAFVYAVVAILGLVLLAGLLGGR